MTSITIRRAGPDDAEPIRRLVLSQPRMNPTGLDWPRFHVADRDGTIVGTVQLRPSAPGVAELGSLVVAPEERGCGLAGRLIATALVDAPTRIMVVTAADNARHYLQWGFREIAPSDAPLAIRLNRLIGQAAGLIRIVRGVRPRRMVVLEAMAPPGGSATADVRTPPMRMAVAAL